MSKQSFQCGSQRRNYFLLTVLLTAPIIINRLLPSTNTSKPFNPVRQLPEQEQQLYKKAIQTNYSTIWMSPPEINLLLRHLHNRQTYLEWGSGGSTESFPRWVTKAVSIEHNQQWCSQMADKIGTDKELQHIDYRCIPIEPSVLWQGGFAEGDYKAFRKYVDEIENTGIELFDFVLIDGRARVDCAVKALSYIHNDSVVVLHDARRVWDGLYAVVKKYYSFPDFVGGVGRQGIAIMRRKKEFAHLQGDHDAVQLLLDNKYLNHRGNQSDEGM